MALLIDIVHTNIVFILSCQPNYPEFQVSLFPFTWNKNNAKTF